MSDDAKAKSMDSANAEQLSRRAGERRADAAALEISTIQELIADGQALVRSLALGVARNIPVPVDLDDLIAYGQVGLAEAAREFDPQQGAQFTTYAYYRVRGAIYDGVSKMSWTSRARYKRYRYERMANEALQAESEAAGSPRSLEQQAQWFRNVSEKLAVVYLASGEDEERGGVRESSLLDPRASPSAMVAGHEISERLRQIVDQLPSVEQRLIRTIYFEGATLQDAASQIGISKSWASRLHAKVLEQLARTLRRLGAE